MSPEHFGPLAWQQEHDVEWRYIAPGKPTQNGSVESFSGRLGDERHDEHLSAIATRPGRSSKNRGSTTTPTDRARASTDSRQPSLQHAPIRGKSGTDCTYERGQVGERVNSQAVLTPVRIRVRSDMKVGNTLHPPDDGPPSAHHRQRHEISRRKVDGVAPTVRRNALVNCVTLLKPALVATSLTGSSAVSSSSLARSTRR